MPTILLDDLKATLPDGVETVLLFQQKDFIDHAIDNLKEAIRDGAIMVTIVIFISMRMRSSRPWSRRRTPD